MNRVSQIRGPFAYYSQMQMYKRARQRNTLEMSSISSDPRHRCSADNDHRIT